MKVRLIKKKIIDDYVLQNASSRRAFNLWLNSIKHADWSEPGHIKKTFQSVDFLGNGSDRLVFNIAGNHFRMICKYYFGTFKVSIFIKWIGTHDEYTSLCKNNKQYSINLY